MSLGFDLAKINADIGTTRSAQNYTTVTTRILTGLPHCIEASMLFNTHTDGNDKLVLNRDDLLVFRLDSMVTHDKASTQQIKGSPTLSTKTDYRANYPNKLQTTSYNFTGTDNIVWWSCQSHPPSLQESSSAHC